MSRQATVLIDGGYFDYINNYARDEYDSDIHVTKLAEELCSEFGFDLLRANFYHAMPYLDDSDSAEERETRRKNARSFFDTIDNLRQVQFEERGRVKEQKTWCDECGTRNVSHNQKGVDVGIAVDLVKIAADSNGPGALILLSGDEDLKHAVRAAKDSHTQVYLGYAYETSYDLYSSEALRREVDEKVNVTEGIVENSIRS